MKDPSGYARSEAEEGLPQLSRILFLRGCWNHIVDLDDDAWIDAAVDRAESASQDGGSGMDKALARLIASGASRRDLMELVRSMQVELLHGITYLIDDPYPALEGLPPDVQDTLRSFGWNLVETSDDGSIGRPITGLHESVLETDPRGAG